MTAVGLLEPDNTTGYQLSKRNVGSGAKRRLAISVGRRLLPIASTRYREFQYLDVLGLSAITICKAKREP